MGLTERLSGNNGALWENSPALPGGATTERKNVNLSLDDS